MPKELLQIGFVERDVFRPFGENEKDHLDDAENQVAVRDDQEPFHITVAHPERYEGKQVGEPDQGNIEIAVPY